MAGGSLIDVLKTVGKTRIRTSDLLKYASQITSALKYLRHVRVLHRDIAARNVLLDESFSSAKLADFGLAVTVQGLGQNILYIIRVCTLKPYRRGWL